MMKSVQNGPRCDAAYVLDGAMDRSVFAKRPAPLQHNQLMTERRVLSLKSALRTAIPDRGRYAFVVGVADLRTRAPRRLEQPFRIASVTKTFVATAVLQLADRGQLQKTTSWKNGFPTSPIPARSQSMISCGCAVASPRRAMRRSSTQSTTIHHVCPNARAADGGIGQTSA